MIYCFVNIIQGTMKVVEAGYKVDLHIHSICSCVKDKGKVSFNTTKTSHTHSGACSLKTQYFS